MNAQAFRHFYNYHFAENRNIWDSYITLLSDEQFTQHVAYSGGSVHNQIVHVMSVDDTWFSGLRGVELPEPLDPAAFDDRAAIRAHWDGVEQRMREYLAALRDDMLFAKPFAEGEDKDLILWQVLLHVANHGTDHRAQLLRLLNDLGVKTTAQDYIFYVYDNVESLPPE
ncbi:MAG TPA: DinB family protein [Herpetosiphonaceae bacterium]